MQARLKADIKIVLKIVVISFPLFLLTIFIVMNLMDSNNIWLRSSLGQEDTFKYFNNTALKGFPKYADILRIVPKNITIEQIRKISYEVFNMTDEIKSGERYGELYYEVWEKRTGRIRRSLSFNQWGRILYLTFEEYWKAGFSSRSKEEYVAIAERFLSKLRMKLEENGWRMSENIRLSQPKVSPGCFSTIYYATTNTTIEGVLYMSVSYRYYYNDIPLDYGLVVDIDGEGKIVGLDWFFVEIEPFKRVQLIEPERVFKINKPLSTGGNIIINEDVFANPELKIDIIYETELWERGVPAGIIIPCYDVYIPSKGGGRFSAFEFEQLDFSSSLNQKQEP